jgi:hypothetical protein
LSEKNRYLKAKVSGFFVINQRRRKVLKNPEQFKRRREKSEGRGQFQVSMAL